MRIEKYTPTEEDIKRAEDNLTPVQRVQSEAHEEGFNLGKEKGRTGEEKFDKQTGTENFIGLEEAMANGMAMGAPENGKFGKFTGITPVTYLFRRADGNYEVHINPQRFISGRIEARGFQGMFDFDPMKTDASYTSKIPAIINLSADGSFRVISKGEVTLL